MPTITRCRLTLHEDTFFSSFEVSNSYQTAPLVGNYALAYALGVCQAPYYNDGAIRYKTDFAEANEGGIYMTPATLVGAPRFTLAQFNAQPDAYWYAMGAGVIVTRPDGGQVSGGGKSWKAAPPEGKLRKVGAENRPQHGRIRFLGLGNVAVFYIISADAYRPPAYIRLGKFMSKARLEAQVVASVQIVEAEQLSIPFLLNPADLSSDTELIRFDLVNVPPTPLIRNSTLSGQFYRLDRETHLPLNMRFYTGQ